MKNILAVLFVFLFCLTQADLAHATPTPTGSGVQQSGVVTAGHLATWAGKDQIQDGGAPLSFTYPGAGVTISTGAAWGTSIPVGTSGASLGLLNSNLTFGGNDTFTNLLTASSFTATGTGANMLPVGTTGQAPSPVNGMVRYDSTLNKLRVSILNAWQSVFTTQDIIPVVNGGAVTVSPEQYGALGNGGVYYGGTLVSPTATVATNSNTAPTAPALTTQTANDFVVSVFGTSTGWSVSPTLSNTRESISYSSGGYGLLVGDQLVTSAGNVSAIAGSTSAGSIWQGVSLALVPSGGSISFVAGNQYSSTSTKNIVLTKPTGTTTGDYLLMCATYYTGIQSLNAPAGWSIIASVTNSANNTVCYNKVAGGSEPSSYTFTYAFNGQTGASAAIMDYRNTSGIDPSATTLTNNTAAFTSAAAGNAICIAPNAGNQSCGTISAYTSSTQVTVNTGLKAATVQQVGYGTSDSSAFNTMLTTAPCSTTGCKVSLGAKKYVLTSALTFPPNLPIIIEGSGLGVGNTANTFINGNNLVNINNGTQLQFLTKSLSQAAITVGGTIHLTSTTANDQIKDLAVYGGVGFGYDGGGADGIDVLNYQGAIIDDVAVFNFTGNGAYIDGIAANNFKDYSENVLFKNFYSSYNGGAGFQVGSATNVYNIENTQCVYCMIEANGGPGLSLVGANIQGFQLLNSTIQWDNVLSSNPEINVPGTVVGGSIDANYIEVDGLQGSLSSSAYSNTTGMIGLHQGSNYYSNSYSYNGINNTATSNLPACSTGSSITNQATAQVYDATMCSNGTTLVGGGGIRCNVLCTGGAWIETGNGSTTVGPIQASQVAIGTATPTAGVAIDMGSTTGAVILPVGTTGQRPSVAEGLLRDNTTTHALEAYINGAWQTVVSSVGGLINLATQVTGTLGVVNGGTGSAIGSIYNLFGLPAPFFTTHMAFGDSITAGSAASPNSDGYAFLLANDEGATLTNWGVSGDQACDQVNLKILLYSNPQTTGNPAYTEMIGTNDANKNGIGSYEAVYQDCHKAGLAWMAIPAAYKIYAQAATATGTWTANNTAWYTGVASYTTQQGATKTFALTTYGGPAYIWYQHIDSDTGTATYSVDGGSAIPFSTATTPAIGPTYNGGTSGVGILRITGLTSGTHNIVVTKTSSGGTLVLAGVGTPSPYPYRGGPIVYSAGVPRQQNDNIASTTAAYDADAQADAALLASDGLPIHFVNIRNYLNATTDMANTEHPNNTGHGHLRDAFEAIMQFVPSSALPPVITQGPAAAASTANYMLTNATNQSSSTNLVPGILVYGTAGYNFGMDLGSTTNTGGGSATRIFSNAINGVTLSTYTSGSSNPTSQSQFTDSLVAIAAASQGYGNVQVVIPAAGSEAGIELNNTGTNGRKWDLYSTGTADNLGAGFFAIADATAQAFRLTINATGAVNVPGIFSSQQYKTLSGGRAVNTGTTTDTIAAGVASTYESANSAAITLTFAAPSGDGERRRVCLKNSSTVTWAETTPATAAAGLPTTFIAGQCVEAVYNSAAGTPTNAPATTWVVY